LRPKGGEVLTNVVAGGNESFESLLRRFTRKVQQDGILSGSTPS